MVEHFRRNQVRRNLLDMYRDNALRSQSYMDTVRLHNFMRTMTEIEMLRFESKQEGLPKPIQGWLFPEPA